MPDVGASTAGAEQPKGRTVEAHPRWVTADMREPWHRDLLAGMTARRASTVADLRKWADGLAYHYSRSGTLEVTACLLALLDALDATQGNADTEAGR